MNREYFDPLEISKLLSEDISINNGFLFESPFKGLAYDADIKGLRDWNVGAANYTPRLPGYPPEDYHKLAHADSAYSWQEVALMKSRKTTETFNRILANSEFDLSLTYLRARRTNGRGVVLGPDVPYAGMTYEEILRKFHPSVNSRSCINLVVQGGPVFDSGNLLTPWVLLHQLCHNGPSLPSLSTTDRGLGHLFMDMAYKFGLERDSLRKIYENVSSSSAMSKNKEWFRLHKNRIAQTGFISNDLFLACRSAGGDYDISGEVVDPAEYVAEFLWHGDKLRRKKITVKIASELYGQKGIDYMNACYEYLESSIRECLRTLVGKVYATGGNGDGVVIDLSRIPYPLPD